MWFKGLFLKCMNKLVPISVIKPVKNYLNITLSFGTKLDLSSSRLGPVIHVNIVIDLSS
jgi:hypothetical protein